MPELQAKAGGADDRGGEVANNGTSSNTIPRVIYERASIDNKVSHDIGGDLGINMSVDGWIASNVEVESSSMVMTPSKRTKIERQDQEEDQRQDRQLSSPRTTSREVNMDNVIPDPRGPPQVIGGVTYASPSS